ncbi:unnamed protein product [Paramecium sonneborni]|uniref:Protein kinase domain-containing protein n=1 Tax=Paramecium sonneborni TaxID=65129 RepID=A0A8S1RCW4_9CILI|nr:unnamed protein product [Paramecium sonneborni]
MSNSQETIDGFIIDYLSEFGHGAFSTCYRCSNPNYKIPLCVKKIIPSVQTETSYMFDREIQVIQLISQFNSNYLVKIIHTSKQSKQCFFFMEYCQQGDLKNFIQQNQNMRRQISIPEILSILIQIINGYKQLYDYGIIHRDIKPANIFLGNNGYFQLADYGMAKILEDPCQQCEQSQVGTPIYASPQTLIEGIYSNKCDVYSLGVLIYELVYQQLPIKNQKYIQFCEALKNTKYNKIQIKPFSLGLGGSESEKEKLYHFLSRSLVYEESSRISWEQLFHLFPDPEKSINFNSLKKQQQPQQISHDLVQTCKFDFSSQNSTQPKKQIQPFSRQRQSSNYNQQIIQNDILFNNQMIYSKQRIQSYQNNQNNYINYNNQGYNKTSLGIKIQEVQVTNKNQFCQTTETVAHRYNEQENPKAKSEQLKQKKIFLKEHDNIIEKIIQFYLSKCLFVEKLITKTQNIFNFIQKQNKKMINTPYNVVIQILEILLNGYQYSCYLNINYLLFKRNKRHHQLQIYKELCSINQQFLDQQIEAYLTNQVYKKQLEQHFQISKIRFNRLICSFYEFQQKFTNFQLNQEISEIEQKKWLCSPKWYYQKYKDKFNEINLNFDYGSEYDQLEDHTIKHLAFSIKFFGNEENKSDISDILTVNINSIVDFLEEKKSMMNIIKQYFQNKNEIKNKN